ncbi:MAG: AAA family ATPase [Desulfobacterales bacterium]|nr:AAA family ATPase [Desulfobacterales bacterium]
MTSYDKRPVVYVFFGLIASGKSTLARAWAERLGIGWYNSDVVRKGLAGSTGARPSGFGQGIYSRAYTRKTYQALADRAEQELVRGRSLVLDASYRCRADRECIGDLAEKHGAMARFILCSCPEAELKRRMEKRALDPTAVSDGRWEIYLKQKRLFEEPTELRPEELITLATQAPVNVLVGRLARALNMEQQAGGERKKS